MQIRGRKVLPDALHDAAGHEDVVDGGQADEVAAEGVAHFLG